MGQPHDSPQRGKGERYGRGQPFLERVSVEETTGETLQREGRKERVEKGESRVKGGWMTMDDDHGRRL